MIEAFVFISVLLAIGGAALIVSVFGWEAARIIRKRQRRKRINPYGLTEEQQRIINTAYNRRKS